MRISFQNRSVHKSSWITFVRITNNIFFIRFIFKSQFPFQTGRKTCTASTNPRLRNHRPEPEADDQVHSKVIDPELDEETELPLEPDESQVGVEGVGELDIGEPLELDRAELAARVRAMRAAR